ncbi:hypothetical protein [Cronobacter phage vB_Cdu_VP8]|nr:hypothetical protein [Cronobacter phage vB_Cdu_VP8]
MITTKQFTIEEFAQKSNQLIHEVVRRMKERDERVTIQVERTGAAQYDIIALDSGFIYGVTISRQANGHVTTTRFYGA